MLVNKESFKLLYENVLFKRGHQKTFLNPSLSLKTLSKLQAGK